MLKDVFSIVKWRELGFISVCIILSFHIVAAQKTYTVNVEEMPPPKSEEFRTATGLLIQYGMKDMSCNPISANPKRDCPVVTVAEAKLRSYHYIYDDEANVWYEFSSMSSDNANYLNRLKDDFRPLGPTIYKDSLGGMTSYGNLILLRIARESPHWYEVEVNEKTRDTKYIPKEDPTWAKADWSDIFNISFNVYIDPELTILLDKPDGKPIECKNYASKHIFARLDGDWMLVNDWTSDFMKRPENTRCKGWIRWRNGREILVGSILNRNEIPNAKTNEDPQ